MERKTVFRAAKIAAALSLIGIPALSEVRADVISSTGGIVRIGVNDIGSLITPGGVGIDLAGFGDGLAPGCFCEAWGVAANGVSGFTGPSAGTSNITALATGAGGLFESNARITSLAGITIKQLWTLVSDTTTGGLFKNTVTISNSTGAVATDVRFGRSMDWDIPPTPFTESVTHRGIALGGTSALLRSTDDGFANADPIGNVANGGIASGNVNTNFEDLAPGADHGSLFLFTFGDLADGASKSFDIFYGAATTEAEADAFVAANGLQIVSYGQDNASPRGQTYIFGFAGVGLPPIDPGVVPEPGTLALLGLGLLGGGLLRRRVAK